MKVWLRGMAVSIWIGLLCACATHDVDTAEPLQNLQDVWVVEHVHWLDGDSGRLDDTLFRLIDVDAPETGERARCDQERAWAEASHQWMMAMTENAHVAVTSEEGRDRRPNPRVLVTLQVNGEDLIERALEEGHVARWPHDGNLPTGPRPTWCDGQVHDGDTPLERAPHAQFIADRDVSFLARDMQTGLTYVLEGSEADRRRTPWSSFKIPNLLLALETGAAQGVNHVFEWDPDRRPPAAHWPTDWRGDQTLQTAFQNSAAWAFQDMALEIGSETYITRLAQWRYGDVDIAQGSDRFWLDHTLQVSPRDQVIFLENVLSGRFDISPDHLQALAQLSQAGVRPDGVLHGKTGAGPVELGNFDGRFEGWYVGYLDRGPRPPIVFATHVEASSYDAIHTFRRALTEKLLDDVTARTQP